MSVGFGFSLPALAQYGGGGNNPFGQLGPTLDLSFVDGATGVTDLFDPNGYTLNTNFIAPEYQVAAQYTIWETNVGLVSKTFSQIITFTRSSPVATYFNSAGVLTTASTDVPRFDYDPVTLAAQGLLIEEARTNLIFPSADFAGGTYGPTNITGVVNAAVAPDGTTTADEVVENTATGFHGFLGPAVNVANATVYTVSVFLKVKSGTRSFFVYGQNTSAYSGVNAGAKFTVSGTVISVGTLYGTTTASVQSVGNGWYRCVAVFPATVAANPGQNLRMVLDDGTGTPSGGAASYTGDGTSGFYIWGAQFEAGAFPTSYIPTTTGTVLRAADVASVNTLSPWYNSVEGTVVAIGQMLSVSGPASRSIFDITDGSTVNRTNGRLLTAASGDQATIRSGGTTQFQASSTNNTTTAIKNFVVAYKTSDFAVTSNGLVPVTQASGAVPVGVNQMQLGNSVNAVEPLCGWIRRIVYYPRRLTDLELRQITLPAGATITTQDYSFDSNFTGNTVAIGS